jgi:hypothetical protein
MKFDIEKVRNYIANSSKTSEVYVGADSERYRKNNIWYADYTVCVIIHIDGSKGCKIFGQTTTERDYDQKKDKPSIRLMNEVMKAAQMYLLLEEVIGERHVEIHLDINPDIHYGSSCVVTQAIGYIRGMCNVIPMVKPNAFAASYAADRYSEIKRYCN